MQWLLCCWVFFALLMFAAPSYKGKLGEIHKDVWDTIKKNPKREGENFYEFINRITHGKMFNLSVEAHAILEKEGHHPPPINHDEIPEFNCIINNKPKHKAKTVHELTPYDVEIIAAFGDSLTAAFGALAYTPIDLFIEYHGVSWSIGGDQTVRTIITLPNIIREYSPNLTGFATGISPPLLAIPSENLDVAVSGNTAYGLMRQAKRFVDKLVTTQGYDFLGSWKVLTLFIGGNDLCSCCRSWKNYRDKYKPANFIKEVTGVLDFLHDNVPKLFVNLVTPPNVTILQDLASPWCDFTHLLECKCGSVFGEKAREFTSNVLKQYQENYTQLIESGRYDTRDDFTVVLQPFFDHTIIPRKSDGSIDRSWFAPDCFHFSGKSHAASALGLWNAMLEPVGKKVKTWKPKEKFHCPTAEHPYFFTRLNSGNHTKHNTMATAEDKQETTTKDYGIGFDRIDPVVILFLVFCMVMLFTYKLVGHLMENRRTLSVSSSSPDKQQPAMFFQSELKELR